MRIEFVAAGVFDGQVLGLHVAAAFQLLQAQVAPDAVIDMHHR